MIVGQSSGCFLVDFCLKFKYGIKQKSTIILLKEVTMAGINPVIMNFIMDTFIN